MMELMEHLQVYFLSHLYLSEISLLLALYVIFLYDMWTCANKVVFLFLIAFLILFPVWLASLLFGMALLGNKFLHRANLYKISKNQMPITSLDIMMTIRNPSALFHLFGHSTKWLIPVTLGLFVLLAGLIVTIFMFLLIRSQIEIIHLTIVLLAFVPAFFCFKHRLYADVQKHLSQPHPFGKDVSNHMGWSLGNWEFDTISTLSQHLGVITFILYTTLLAKKQVPIFLKKTKVQSSVSTINLNNVSKHYITLTAAKSHDYKYPNIVTMQCESLFDPARAFVLSKNYKNSIFTANEFTKCLCPLRVNIIGGGSWISEFEFLTGLDTRLFGYLGFYTHVTLAPYIRAAFPSFLAAHGYHTKAFYPAAGKFYNAEKAYRRYGFQEFLDSRMLNLPHEWSSSDVEIANAFIKKTHEFDSELFFSFIVTNGAHSPYNPNRYLDPTKWMNSFQADCDFIMNAKLNEYLRLLGQTEKAIQLLIERLVQIENITGRPFVFIIYGDHQPHEFTGSYKNNHFNYDIVRRDFSKNQTFVHIMSSIDHFKLDFKEEIPVSILPSILSAFVVGNHKDLYALPNFYLYDKNGSNFFPNLNAPGRFGFINNENLSSNDFSIGSSEAHIIEVLKQLRIMNIVT